MTFSLKQARERALPEVMYHYTTTAGLLGILQTGVLWASSVEHLNDALENRHFRQMACDDLQQRLRLERGPWNTFYGQALERMQGDREFVFAASFSEDGDLLSQWRAYSQGSTGYCLGFRSANLARAARRAGGDLLKCFYTREEQLQCLDEVLGTAGDIADSHGSDLATSAYVDLIEKLSPTAKHSSFAEEREWRVVVPKGPQMGYRISNFGLVPYVDLSIGLRDQAAPVLDSIVVGPNAHMNLAVKTVSALIESLEMSGVRVLESGSSFRAH